MAFIPHIQTCKLCAHTQTRIHTHPHTYTRAGYFLREMSVSYNVKELYSGVLNKCGARVKSWNRRWFVLKSDYCLYYYKDTAKGHLGAISLRDPKFKARKGSVSDIAWPKGAAIESTIAVVTSHRTYLMYGSGEQEADDWVRILNSTREKLLEEANSANRLLSGSRSYSATTVNNKASSSNGTSKSRGLSESVPPPLLEDGPELTYEAVYDSPEADLSQSGSSNGSPNLNTKQGERHTSTTDSIYDLASGEEGGGRHDDQHDDPVDTSQPLYAEAAEPDEQSGQEDEPSAVYDDVEMTHHTSTSHTPQRQANGSGGGGKDKPVEMYEPIDAESPHTPSAKHLPLPAIPMATRNASSANGGSQPIYEDIADTSGAQPLYEAVSVDDSATLDKYIQEAERSDDEGSGSLPPLPPKDDLPPLPPKDNNAPQLPPKGDQSSPSLPPKTEVKVPPLPPKEDAPASSHNMNTATHVPPSLPVKDEGPEGSHQPPLASPRHVQPPSSPSPGQQASGGTSNLSPSGQRKPTPRERTITPPPMKKPSPVPRRRVSPTTAGQGSAAAVDGSPVTRRVSPTTGGQGNATANSPV